jgi:hypothetical protein
MLSIKKYQILDENNKPYAVQIPIEDFEKLEELIENYGLSKLMDETIDDEVMKESEAKVYYSTINKS